MKYPTFAGFLWLSLSLLGIALHSIWGQAGISSNHLYVSVCTVKLLWCLLVEYVEVTWFRVDCRLLYDLKVTPHNYSSFWPCYHGNKRQNLSGLQERVYTQTYTHWFRGSEWVLMHCCLFFLLLTTTLTHLSFYLTLQLIVKKVKRSRGHLFGGLAQVKTSQSFVMICLKQRWFQSKCSPLIDDAKVDSVRKPSQVNEEEALQDLHLEILCPGFIYVFTLSSKNLMPFPFYFNLHSTFTKRIHEPGFDIRLSQNWRNPNTKKACWGHVGTASESSQD